LIDALECVALAEHQMAHQRQPRRRRAALLQRAPGLTRQHPLLIGPLARRRFGLLERRGAIVRFLDRPQQRRPVLACDGLLDIRIRGRHLVLQPEAP
jgi:hypothetical protein